LLNSVGVAADDCPQAKYDIMKTYSVATAEMTFLFINFSIAMKRTPQFSRL
jgi:hypothetical protein